MSKISKTKEIKTTTAALQDDSDTSLPPLMNPAMLEASDDLTNLSHLNEPAGMEMMADLSGHEADGFYSLASYQITIFTERDLYVQRYRADCNQSICSSRFSLRSWNGAGLRWQAKVDTGSSPLRNCRGSIHVRHLVSSTLHWMLIRRQRYVAG